MINGANLNGQIKCSVLMLSYFTFFMKAISQSERPHFFSAHICLWTPEGGRIERERERVQRTRSLFQYLLSVYFMCTYIVIIWKTIV